MISGNNNTILASGNAILDLIPQRSPIVMVDTLFYSDEEKTVSGFTVDSSCIFFAQGGLTEPGLIENIAQTAAAGTGYYYKKENKNVPVGFIATIKDLKIHALPKIGVQLITEVKVTNKVMDVTIIRGEVKTSDTLIAECEMRIFVKPE